MLEARKWSSRRAAEKQKEEVGFAFCPINRPPLAGFAAQTSKSQAYVRQLEMWVMTRVSNPRYDAPLNLCYHLLSRR